MSSDAFDKRRSSSPKRALTLAGGGPAVGIALGVLRALKDFPEIKFDVWSLSCVGAWLGCLYHASPKPKRTDADKLKFVESLMERFFRPDKVYDNFPCPTVFLPDIPEMISAYLRFMIDPRSYSNLIVPNEIRKGYEDLLYYYLRPSRWSYGDFCHLMLNAILAPNPAARFLMSMIYKSDIPGLNKLWFGPDYHLLKDLDMKLLEENDVPTLYHNAYNVDPPGLLQLFSNKNRKYPKITAQTLCACSGLPYILSPVKINGSTYVEGATIDTVVRRAKHGTTVQANRTRRKVWKDGVFATIEALVLAKKPSDGFKWLVDANLAELTAEHIVTRVGVIGRERRGPTWRFSPKPWGAKNPGRSSCSSRPE